MSSPPTPVVLCILDGWGIGQTEADNAPLLAKTPNMDRLLADCPNATLRTHGADVGLPEGQMGNSEVGHTNIGAGRVVAMDLGQIDLSIEGPKKPQIKGDKPGLFLVYPQGNFIGATDETPYLQIGEVKYGKPILDRIIQKDTPLTEAALCLSQDEARIAVGGGFWTPASAMGRLLRDRITTHAGLSFEIIG